MNGSNGKRHQHEAWQETPLLALGVQSVQIFVEDIPVVFIKLKDRNQKLLFLSFRAFKVHNGYYNQAEVGGYY